MNRALDSKKNEDNPKYFGTQSEQKIYSIGCFEVEKESQEALSWVLSQTKIYALILAQRTGKPPY